MSIAFFDLDKTLLAENSVKLWLKERWANRQIKLTQMVHASYWLAKYHLGFTKMEEVIEKGLSILVGESQEAVLKNTEEFFKSTIRHLYRPGAIAALKMHKTKGHKVSILTSTFNELAHLVQEDLHFDYCLSTRLEVSGHGLYTGRTLGPPCFGKFKVTYAKELCDSLKIGLTNCAFYTDSASDVPLLNLVKDAVAVNPDPHLRARAQIKKWQIVDWGKPEWMTSD